MTKGLLNKKAPKGQKGLKTTAPAGAPPTPRKMSKVENTAKNLYYKAFPPKATIARGSRVEKGENRQGKVNDLYHQARVEKPMPIAQDGTVVPPVGVPASKSKRSSSLPATTSKRDLSPTAMSGSSKRARPAPYKSSFIR